MGASHLPFWRFVAGQSTSRCGLIGGSCWFARVPRGRGWTRAGRNRRPDITAACPLALAASLDQRLTGGFVMVTGNAVQPATGQRLPDGVFSLMLAEVAGGKRRD
jgi:hypothetical protein